MKIPVPCKVLKALTAEEDGPYEELSNYFSSWKSDWDVVELETDVLTEAQLKAIRDFVNEDSVANNKANYERYSALYRKLSTYDRLRKTGATGAIKRLADIPDSFKAFISAEMPNRRIYKIEEDSDKLDPYVVFNCKYEPPSKDCPAYVTFTFIALREGVDETTSFTVHIYDLMDSEGNHKNIARILESNNVMPESPELNDEYEKHLQKYKQLIKMVGDTYVARGSGTKKGSRSYDRTLYHFKKEELNKVVVDFDGYLLETDNKTLSDRKEDLVKHSTYFGERVTKPIHVYGTVFHLDDHVWVSVHVSSIEPYKFKGKELINKLVLPADHKQLMEILINMSKHNIQDIIEGKQGGSFILATGPPGTGKTLAAEVFSEAIEKPLYKVQCSQLGLDVDTVEKKLKHVLARASRWGAILLTDEADVYIRERGDDIMQNAIVGVFLRTLEYYTGILFMTSNLGKKIDDAIKSRATAHFEFLAPTYEERVQIWTILKTQFEIDLVDAEIIKLAEAYECVGRDIKAMLKLGKVYAEGTKEQLTADMIRTLSGFVPNVAELVNAKKQLQN